jgi:hypothetical protein
LRQQERQEEFSKPISYQPSRELLFASLFYQDFLQKLFNGEESQQVFIQALLAFAQKIVTALPESQLARIFTGTLTEQEI